MVFEQLNQEKLIKYLVFGINNDNKLGIQIKFNDNERYEKVCYSEIFKNINIFCIENGIVIFGNMYVNNIHLIMNELDKIEKINPHVKQDMFNFIGIDSYFDNEGFIWKTIFFRK